MATTPADGPATMVARVSAVLGAFGPQDLSLGVAELARRTELPKSTVHRVLHQLVEHGFLERERDGTRVRLGLRLFELGELAAPRQDLRDVAIPLMADLREATRHTVHLAVLEGTEVVYVQILRTKDAPLRLPSRTGGRLPAHATGVGKALLAFSPPEVTDAVIATGLPAIGPRTTSSPGLLRLELARIRQSGVSYDHEESAIGVVCAASPVLDAKAQAVAALSVSGWSGRLNLGRIAPAVRTAALALGRTLPTH
ncbi:IclR family transcriptional regulator [Streptomyces sp. NPDC055092]